MLNQIEKDIHDISQFEISAMLGNLESLKAWLECSAVPTGKAMIRAALNDEFDAMKMLQSYGGDITQTDEDGCTTLHYIAQDGTVEMVKYLVESGVPIDATCRGKETALKWAHFDNKLVVFKHSHDISAGHLVKLLM